MGTVLSVLLSVVYYALLLYFFVMWGRFILELTRSVNPRWRPRGFVLVLSEIVYSVTDPPVKFFRRILPPMRFGQIALDFGWAVAMFCVIIAMNLTSFLARVV